MQLEDPTGRVAWSELSFSLWVGSLAWALAIGLGWPVGVESRALIPTSEPNDIVGEGALRGAERQHVGGYQGLLIE